MGSQEQEEKQQEKQLTEKEAAVKRLLTGKTFVHTDTIADLVKADLISPSKAVLLHVISALRWSRSKKLPFQFSYQKFATKYGITVSAVREAVRRYQLLERAGVQGSKYREWVTPAITLEEKVANPSAPKRPNEHFQNNDTPANTGDSGGEVADNEHFSPAASNSGSDRPITAAISGGDHEPSPPQKAAVITASISSTDKSGGKNTEGNARGEGEGGECCSTATVTVSNPTSNTNNRSGDWTDTGDGHAEGDDRHDGGGNGKTQPAVRNAGNWIDPLTSTEDHHIVHAPDGAAYPRAQQEQRLVSLLLWAAKKAFPRQQLYKPRPEDLVVAGEILDLMTKDGQDIDAIILTVLRDWLNSVTKPRMDTLRVRDFKQFYLNSEPPIEDSPAKDPSWVICRNLGSFFSDMTITRSQQLACALDSYGFAITIKYLAQITPLGQVLNEVRDLLQSSVDDKKLQQIERKYAATWLLQDSDYLEEDDSFFFSEFEEQLAAAGRGRPKPPPPPPQAAPPPAQEREALYLFGDSP
ncbi:MAG: hypothetical protein K8T26_01610 [Lentisphaerae bacterium]|nr:hypothetical protein [Lentisphaerota bacterium]